MESCTKDIITAATALALELSEGKDINEVIELKNFIGQLYNTLGIIISQKAVENSRNKDNCTKK